MKGGDAYAVTCPLITKADGGKFGKSEGGNVWLDAKKTSPYKFYQFWLNASDEDMPKYLRIFSLKTRQEIEALEADHLEAPHLRLMQKALAEELTARVHGAEQLDLAVKASNILFGKSTSEDLKSLDEQSILDVFDGVPTGSVSESDLNSGLPIIDFLSEVSGFLASKGEARRALKENSISVNKDKVKDDFVVDPSHILADKFILLQRGKKNYFLVQLVR